MTRHRALLGSLCALMGWIACRPAGNNAAQAAEAAARRARLASRLTAPATGFADDSVPLARWLLPKSLSEISGIALTPDGRLLTNGDERGRITVIDPRGGAILERFQIGATGIRGDFEGLTVANGKIYMIQSNGTLYEFREGADGAQVPFAVHDTQLGHECEFEGVAFEARSESLLLPCKKVGKKALRDQLVIYRWNLQGAETPRISMLTVPLSRLIGSTGWAGLHPSDITIDPATGDYVMVASTEHALIEITPSGGVVRVTALPGSHPQAEGVAVTRDGVLIVSDEATGGRATITLYRWPPPPTPERRS